MTVLSPEMRKRLNRLQELATVGERLILIKGLPVYVQRELTDERIRSYYELAYLRACYTWEWFLEESFLESLTKNAAVSPGGKLRQPPFRNAAEARSALLAKDSYISWGNVGKATQALGKFVDSGIHERVIRSYSSRLNAYLSVRHHIAHESRSSKTSFEAATRMLNAKVYTDGPGAFLRDRDRNQNQPTKWFASIVQDFASLASQIAP